MDQPTYKTVIKSLHTSSVQEVIGSYIPNKVLNSRPPEINKSEALLSRRERSRLSQLRSGYSPVLNSYLSRIDSSIPNICPLCSQSPHDTLHLFNCDANPTELNVTDLWTRPTLAADFLKLKDPD
jgi:hypothetical protein